MSNHSPVAMVSGGTRGIGLAIARELLAHGWRVSVGARSATDAYAGYSADQVRVHRFDAEDKQSETDWVAATVRDFGGIDAQGLGCPTDDPDQQRDVETGEIDNALVSADAGLRRVVETAAI